MTSYNSQRVRNLFVKDQVAPFKLSRSKIEAYLKCPRCFYLDRRCGTGHPPGYPFTLNNAVDTLLKKEFDKFRERGQPHPLMLKHRIDAIPFGHPELDNWRQNLKGIQYLHEPTHFIITGAVDDLWVNPQGELIVVDYKATSTSKETTLNQEYRQAYKRQMEIYQWLFRRNGFKVAKTGFFVYCDGNAGKESFSGKLEFDISLLPYEGDDFWVEQTLFNIRQCLAADEFQKASEACDFCKYRMASQRHLSKEEARKCG